MELMQEEVKAYSDEEGEEDEVEEEEEEEITTTTREESSSKNQHHYNNSSPFSSPSLSFSSSSPSTTTNHHPPINIPHHQHQIPWFNMNLHDHHHHHVQQNSPESHNSSSGLGLKQIDFMELSLGNNNKDASTSTSVNVVPSTSQIQQPSEKEHMFDKVVTPSDVGKLNRLVIPKQHAEKYFPLDSTTNEKGLLLNFEDRNGKLWRFRYSYWNSSQSYVMTKGWSRFVKEKKLDAGDIVSFQRGVGELYRHRLYIDWRRRSNHMNMNINVCDPSTPTIFTPFLLPNQPPHYSMIRWGSTPPSASATAARLYSSNSPQTSRHYYNYHMYQPFNQQQNHPILGSGSGNHQYNNYHELSSSSTSSSAAAAGGYYMRSSVSAAAASMPIFSDVQRQQQEEGRRGANVSVSPMIIDSIPVAHHYHQQQQYGGNSSNSAAKRLRLFGVNMECGSSTNIEDIKCCDSIPSSSTSLQPHQHEETLSVSVSPSRTRFGDQRGEGSSMRFDLDPSLQYRQ